MDSSPTGCAQTYKAVERFDVANIHRVENHDEALPIWQSSGQKKQILVHIDAHHDMWWAETAAEVSIANFIGRAVAEDLVREVWWVVPDRSWCGVSNRAHLIHHVRKIIAGYPGAKQRLEIRSNGISGSVMGKPLRVVSVDSLPEFSERVWLDVDVDYLLLPRVTYGGNDLHPVLPWRWPEELVKRLTARGLRANLISIAYSVEGGYTPLEWKYLGDELATRLAGADGDAGSLAGFASLREGTECEARGDLAAAEEQFRKADRLLPESAAPMLRRARVALAAGRLDDAQKFCALTYAADASYRTAFFTEGFWSYWGKQLDRAEVEFRRMLGFDPQDPYARVGLGRIAAKRRQWQAAADQQGKALALNPELLDGHRGLGEALSHLGRTEEAISAYEQSLRLALSGHRPITPTLAATSEAHQLQDYGHWQAYFALARLHARNGAPARAASCLRMVTNAWPNQVAPRLQLAVLHLRQNDGRSARREFAQALLKLPGAGSELLKKNMRWLRKGIHRLRDLWQAV